MEIANIFANSFAHPHAKIFNIDCDMRKLLEKGDIFLLSQSTIFPLYFMLMLGLYANFPGEDNRLNWISFVMLSITEIFRCEKVR